MHELAAGVLNDTNGTSACPGSLNERLHVQRLHTANLSAHFCWHRHLSHAFNWRNAPDQLCLEVEDLRRSRLRCDSGLASADGSPARSFSHDDCAGASLRGLRKRVTGISATNLGVKV